MSTHTRPEPRHASPAEPDDGTDSAADPAPMAPFDAHDSAATFDAADTDRLPNTVDGENEHVAR